MLIVMHIWINVHMLVVLIVQIEYAPLQQELLCLIIEHAQIITIHVQ